MVAASCHLVLFNCIECVYLSLECVEGFRHEPPVMTDDVEILVKEDDVVTVCKPASVPVSTTSLYLFSLLLVSGCRINLFFWRM